MNTWNVKKLREYGMKLQGLNFIKLYSHAKNQLFFFSNKYQCQPTILPKS